MTSSIGTRDFSEILTLKPISFGKNSFFVLFFIVLGGLPLYMPILWYIGEQSLGSNSPIYWTWWANFIVSMPHTWATYWRLSRKIHEGKVHWLFGWPAYLAILALLIVATLKGYFLPVFTVVNVWQSLHYVRQFYGVSRVYGRGDSETPLIRKLSFWAYHAAMPLFIIGRWDTLYTAWGGKATDQIIPVAFPSWLMNGLWFIAAIALLVGICSEVLKYKASQAEYNCTGLILLIVYFWVHWYGFLNIQYYIMGFVMITIFHAMQYLGIVWDFEDRQSTTNAYPSKYFKLLPFGLSFAAFWFVLWGFGSNVQDHLFTIGNVLWAQFSSTCLSSISTHHYLVDTALWGKKTGL